MRHGGGVLLPKEGGLDVCPGESILSIHLPNNRASKYMIELIGQKEKYTHSQSVGKFTTLFFLQHWKTGIEFIFSHLLEQLKD